MNEIHTSLDWAEVQTALEAPVHKLNKYNRQMFLISKNIGIMVNELSKEEVNCRSGVVQRGGKPPKKDSLGGLAEVPSPIRQPPLITK
jgi:hypothetical protein